jgi:SAM-dependent methyltransferase
MRRTIRRFCAPIVSATGAHVPPSSSGALQTSSGQQAAFNLSLNNVFTPERAIILAQQEEERRVARHEKLYENMLVFQGGIIKDVETLGQRLLTRDFVQYSMYHYKWGYYPKLHRKYRELMTTGFFDPIPFGSLAGQYDYEEYVAKTSEASPTFATPASLFQPFYGWALAEYMITTMRAKHHPREPLIIYEVGAGSGNLAISVLDFLAEQYPEVYANCEYHLIDLSKYMIPVQRKKLVAHMNHVHIHHISIHNWRELEPRRCFVLGLELLSNMPHDRVTWADDGSAYEQWLELEEKDNLTTANERYHQVMDPLILRYLRTSNWMHESSYNEMRMFCLTDGQTTVTPPKFGAHMEPSMYDNVWQVVTKSLAIHDPFRIAWLPIGQMVMFEVLAEFFPRHHALFADWNCVTSAIMGINGPLLQSKVRVAKDVFLRSSADHLLHNAGMVDMCFPTDFDKMVETYKSICGEHKEVMNMTHPDFWKTHGGEKTAIFSTRDGFNPLLEDFGAFSVFASNHPAEM